MRGVNMMNLENWKEPSTYLNESDGLLHCTECNEPRQHITNFPVVGTVVYCNCSCINIHESYIKMTLNAQGEYLRRVTRQQNAFAETCKKAMEWRFDVDDHKSKSDVINICRNYAKNFDKIENGAGLLIYGGVGVGKSFCSACIVNALLEKGYECLMTDFITIINEYNKAPIDKKQEYIHKIASYDLLVIDDLGLQSTTQHAYAIATTVINARVMSDKPIIATTNLTVQQLLGTNDINYQRMLSRLFEKCTIIEYTGEDRRKKNAMNGNPEFLRLLGIK